MFWKKKINQEKEIKEIHIWMKQCSSQYYDVLREMKRIEAVLEDIKTSVDVKTKAILEDVQNRYINSLEKSLVKLDIETSELVNQRMHQRNVNQRNYEDLINAYKA